ncbi:MAG: ATP-dependent sacrificial sulfur transferase LarE [Myxococcota bacterium]|nr:ATP-dependent sacrificial sulfur transferase LarE [Myxococcota bacterium]
MSISSPTDMLPNADISNTLRNKLNRLTSILDDMREVIVTFSGGVDSTFLLAVSHEVLGAKAVALTAVSGTLPEAEYAEAKELALEMGVTHYLLDSHELEQDGYRKNGADRCFHCKTELYTIATQRAAELGIPWVVDGCNLDDLGDYRPGRKAAKDHAIRSPLIEAEMTKSDIRELSEAMGLRTARKAAFACLGSRFPYGTEITRSRLERIAACEQYLRDHGFHQFRCRFHDTIVRIEVAPDDLQRLIEPVLRTSMVEYMKAQGFTYVTVDLQGYRQGAMNETLTPTDPNLITKVVPLSTLKR